MTTRRPTFRTQWIHRDEPELELVSARMQKALKLERPGPGIVVTVPLDLLPEYLELYRLEPLPRLAGIGELPNPILKVKRVPTEGK